MVDHTNDILSPYKSVETTFLFSNLYSPLQHAATFVFNSFSCGKWCYHHILEHQATSKPMAYVLLHGWSIRFMWNVTKTSMRTASTFDCVHINHQYSGTCSAPYKHVG